MATLYLRYLSYTRQTNIVLEQLVRLKEEGFLRELQGVRLNFFRLLTPMNPMVVDILGQILVDTAVIPVKPKIMADFGKMFEGAGMILKVHQSEQSHTF
ncbi:hypothetical protein KJE20_09147 [Pyrenophora tritici-repentis]|nr:hypothetical protein KJE20_09147 [Pyrenophora tritici-repentis]